MLLNPSDQQSLGSAVTGLDGQVLAQAPSATAPGGGTPQNPATQSTKPPVARPGVPPPEPAPSTARRGQAVEMGPSIIPFLFGAVILILYYFPSDDRRPEIRKRLSRDRDFYLILALIPVGLVVISYLLSPWRWPVLLAWIALPAVLGIALRWLLGPDRAELQEGIELPEDLRKRMDD